LVRAKLCFVNLPRTGRGVRRKPEAGVLATDQYGNAYMLKS
jgi:hypothetical protein